MSDSEFELEFDDDEVTDQIKIEQAHLQEQLEQSERAKNLQQLEAERRLLSIKDSTQRYLALKRLDEMNLYGFKLLQQQLKFKRLEISSISGSFRLGIAIKLEDVIKVVPNGELKRHKRSVLWVEFNNPSISMGINSSGYISIMGAKTTSDMYLAARRLTCIIQKHLYPTARMTDFAVKNIVVVMDYPESIDLIELEKNLLSQKFDANRPPSFSCLQTKLTQEQYLKIIQEQQLQLLKEQREKNELHNNNNTNLKTEADIKQEQLSSPTTTTTTTTSPTTTATTTTTTTTNPTTTTTSSTTTSVLDETKQYIQTLDNLLNKRETFHYPPDLEIQHSLKIFGTGSILIMGLRSLGSVLIVANLWYDLITKYNVKHEYTSSQRFGSFISRSVKINEDHQSLLPYNASTSNYKQGQKGKATTKNNKSGNTTSKKSTSSSSKKGGSKQTTSTKRGSSTTADYNNNVDLDTIDDIDSESNDYDSSDEGEWNDSSSSGDGEEYYDESD